jgi:S-adenosylhomocysteine hydrolase
MLAHQAMSVGDAFRAARPVGTDDMKSPVFYEAVNKKFQLDQKLEGQREVIIVIVLHFVHSAVDFLTTLAKLGRVVAVISKSTKTVDEVRERLNALYKDYIDPSLTKENIASDPECLKTFIQSLREKYPPDRFQLVLGDHGGYFAKHLNTLVAENLDFVTGVVEHTSNGHDAYEKYLARFKSFPVPVWSIATTKMKHLESHAVAQSLLTVLNGFIYSGMGINQDMSRIMVMLLGYGEIGGALGKLIAKDLSIGSKLFICDTDVKKHDRARKELASFSVTPLVTDNMRTFLGETDLIVVATSAQAITREDISYNIKSGACLVCVTSSDSLFEKDAFDDFEKMPTQTSEYITVYQMIGNPSRKILLAVNGLTLNFVCGSTALPIIFAIFALFSVTIKNMVQEQHTAGPKAHTKILKPSRSDQDKLNRVWEKHFGVMEGYSSTCCMMGGGYGVPLWKKIDTFIGREAALATIEKKFKDKKLLAITSTTPKGSEEAGYGKKALALHYLSLHREDFPLVVWVDVKKIKEVFLNLGKELKIRLEQPAPLDYNELVAQPGSDLFEAKIAQSIHDTIDRTKKKCLFVFVDAPNIESIRPYLPAQSERKDQPVRHRLIYSLVTSREALGWPESLVLGAFSPEDAKAYMECGRSITEEYVAAVLRKQAWTPSALKSAMSGYDFSQREQLTPSDRSCGGSTLFSDDTSSPRVDSSSPPAHTFTAELM